MCYTKGTCTHAHAHTPLPQRTQTCPPCTHWPWTSNSTKELLVFVPVTSFSAKHLYIPVSPAFKSFTYKLPDVRSWPESWPRFPAPFLLFFQEMLAFGADCGTGHWRMAAPPTYAVTLARSSWNTSRTAESGPVGRIHSTMKLTYFKARQLFTHTLTCFLHVGRAAEDAPALRRRCATPVRALVKGGVEMGSDLMWRPRWYSKAQRFWIDGFASEFPP